MGSFNYIELTGVCPICNELAYISAQLHGLSSFDGDETGRFCLRVYRIGEKLKWWNNVPAIDGNLTECCYGDCGRCGHELYIIVNVEGFIIRKIEGIGKVSDWPIEYER